MKGDVFDQKAKCYDLLLGILLFGIDRIFWASEPLIQTQYPEPSFELSLVMIFHGMTILGLPLIMIGSGRYLASVEKTLAKAINFGVIRY